MILSIGMVTPEKPAAPPLPAREKVTEPR
jgi:hypothetical protein